MQDTFFTSDTHFNHNLMSKLRGFESIEAHDEEVIKTWNSVVGSRDVIYHLGDFGFGDEQTLKKLRFRLNGKITLILGNHDQKNRLYNKPWFSEKCEAKTITINHQKIVLCHFPYRIWNLSHYGSWHLYGHIHTGLNFLDPFIDGKSMDVGLDMFKRPISIDEVCEIMRGLPNNKNLRSNHDKKNP